MLTKGHGKCYVGHFSERVDCDVTFIHLPWVRSEAKVLRAGHMRKPVIAHLGSNTARPSPQHHPSYAQGRSASPRRDERGLVNGKAGAVADGGADKAPGQPFDLAGVWARLNSSISISNYNGGL